MLPVTAIEYVPGAVFEAAMMVMVKLVIPFGIACEGLKLTVTPAGCPVADKFTVELVGVPPGLFTEMVDVPLLPGNTVTDEGDAAESEKLVTYTFQVVDVVTPAPVPVMTVG